MATPPTPQATAAPREMVAAAVAREKSYDGPVTCRRFGLADGTVEEAN